MAFWDNAGGSIIGTGLNFLGGLISSNIQQNNTKELMGLQQQYNKEQAAYNQKLAKDMWTYTNYPNQVKQMDKAGLSPALLYGQAGAGGGSTAGAGNAAGVSGGTGAAPNFGDLGSTFMAGALLKAQKENIEADTANKLSNVPVNQTTANLKKAETELTNAETEFKRVTTNNEKLKGKEIEKNISVLAQTWMKLVQETNKLNQEWKNLQTVGQINKKELAKWEETYNNKMANLKANTAYLWGMYAKSLSDVELNEQQIRKLGTAMLKDVQEVWQMGELTPAIKNELVKRAEKIAKETGYLSQENARKWVDSIWGNLNGTLKAGASFIDAIIPM